MAAGKWITDLSPDSSYLDASRHVLTVRLEAVRHFLESIRDQVDLDPEYVHQLRVSTRRAKAALDVFKNCLPKKAARRIRKSLKDFRRAAGAVRDWDVFLHGLSSHKETRLSRLRPALDLVSGLALSARDSARTALLEATAEQPFAFERLLTKTLADLRRPRKEENVRLGDVASRILSRYLEALRKSTEAALEDNTKLHLVRIAGKRLRYAMEIFGDCFAGDFKERLYPLVEELQELLGVLHDSDVASRQLEKWRERTAIVFAADVSRYRPGIDALIKGHQEVISKQRKGFQEKWQELEDTFGSAGFEELLLKSQRGELVSIAGKDSTAPAGLDGLPPAVDEVGLTGAPPGGSA
jgi:CHAD domain-containing protein